jgi:hypothetical protein
MMRQYARDPAILAVLAIWLIACAVMLAVHWPAAVAGTFSDSDDYMRLLEVRDWLAGQSWWDVTQYRLDPPTGGPMHWSRLVDLPIAAGIAGLTPFLGRATAEAVTVAAVPLVILGLIMALAARVARRLFASLLAPIIAVLLVATAGAIGGQTFPTRIDHHGWQILAAATALAALLDPRPTRSGTVAGVALAVWLNISIEGLPFAVAAAGAVALRWLIAPAPEGRRFAALLAALAIGSGVLFAATHAPGSWTMRWCDAITPAHILVFAGAAAGSAALVRFAGGWTLAGRLAGLAVLGAVCAAAFLSLAPGCAASPFGTLDPLVHDVWYLNVLEGMPLWRQAPVVAMNLLFFPAVGLVGSALAWRAAATPEARRDWLTIIILLVASTLLMIMLRRAGGVAQFMAVPGAIAIIEPLRARAARFANSIARAIGTVAAICLPSPLTPIYASALLPAEPVVAGTGTGTCNTRCRLAPLAMLPPATILTTIDQGAPILALTHHNALAGPYHRADRALVDLIRAFTERPEVAHAIVRRHRIGYVLVDPLSGEAALYAGRSPAGLMARLRRGEAPGWLVPVPGPADGLLLWRVIG